nr:hypothetical protein [Tanacetum cinerariifolium]
MFVARFTKEILGIQKQTDGYYIVAYISGLQFGRFLKDLIDSLPSTLANLIGRAKRFDMVNAKRGREQSDDGS